MIDCLSLSPYILVYQKSTLPFFIHHFSFYLSLSLFFFYFSRDFPPFELTIEGDELRGRGTTDCLGFIIIYDFETKMVD